jgi:hypothetical protein
MPEPDLCDWQAGQMFEDLQILVRELFHWISATRALKENMWQEGAIVAGFQLHKARWTRRSKTVLIWPRIQHLE